MSFARAVAFVLRPSNDGQPYHVTPGDPGGATAYGWALRENRDLTDDDLRRMTPSIAAERYRTTFWREIHGDELPEILQLPVLDMAVVEGSEEAIRALQRAVYVKDDGKLGPATLGALSGANQETVNRFCAERIHFLSAKEKWPEFGLGWSKRVIASAVAAIS